MDASTSARYPLRRWSRSDGQAPTTLVGRGSGIAEDGRSVKLRVVDISLFGPESCRAVSRAIPGSADLRRSKRSIFHRHVLCENL
jgi:hypothetical protein